MTALQIETKSLLLRPFVITDSPDMHRLAGDKVVADLNVEMPYPLSYREAVDWVAYMMHEHEVGNQVILVMTNKKTQEFMGSIELVINHAKQEAELGYWLGYPYWNHGYCTEAALEMVKHGFEQLKLKKIFSVCFEFNPASRRVIQKSGMKFLKRYPMYVEKWETFETVEEYIITVEDYFASLQK